jgi:hypothetical protein
MADGRIFATGHGQAPFLVEVKRITFPAQSGDTHRIVAHRDSGFG